MRQHYVHCLSPAGFHRMAYVEWGDPANPRVVVCVHGLTRTGRDFDFLAQALAADYRVVCPDVAGRGLSDRFPDPALYAVPQYAQDMAALIARLDVETVDWLGTSMGGLIGMALAAQAGAPIRKLILNDVGPVVSAPALQRIGAYLAGAPARFADLAAVEAYARLTYGAFGPHDDAQWRALARNTVRPDDAGGWVFHYDKGIVAAFAQAAAALDGRDMALWPLYDAIRCPTLAIRGELSDLLTCATLAAMAERGPRAQIAEIAAVGHAPTFMHDAQVGLVRDFLAG